MILIPGVPTGVTELDAVSKSGEPANAKYVCASAARSAKEHQSLSF